MLALLVPGVGMGGGLATVAEENLRGTIAYAGAGSGRGTTAAAGAGTIRP